MFAIESGKRPEPKGLGWIKVFTRHRAISCSRKYRRWRREELTLNTINEEGTEKIDTIVSADASASLLRSELKMLLASLPHEQFRILYAIYFLGKTEQQIAAELHFTQQKVNRLKKRALYCLRQELTR